jgi:four helix bundle protein
MFLQLNHQNLEAYKAARLLIKECYKITARLPPEERFSLVPQIRRAAISVKLNIAEGSSRKSLVERNRFYEISRGSAVEIDSAFETVIDLEYLKEEAFIDAAKALNSVFALLTKLIKGKEVAEVKGQR